MRTHSQSITLINKVLRFRPGTEEARSEASKQEKTKTRLKCCARASFRKRKKIFRSIEISAISLNASWSWCLRRRSCSLKIIWSRMSYDLLTDGMVDFVWVLNSGGTVQYKLDAQSLRLFGHHGDVNDAQPAGANRLQNNKTRPLTILQHLRKESSHLLRSDTWGTHVHAVDGAPFLHPCTQPNHSLATRRHAHTH